MARKKATRRRSRKSFKILDALEALAYGQILSTGITGGGLWEFATGKQDLGYRASSQVFDQGLGVGSMTSSSLVGTDIISLKDFISEPTLAIQTMTDNFAANIVPMATAGLLTGISFNIGRRVLRRPINNFNRNIMKPLLGSGVKL
tara:strand:- start:112 stop:549 length:438 start_codon:yes stop_codon:yes gene_type:complete